MTPHAMYPLGRPTIYTEVLAERIAALYAEGHSWRAIAAMPDMPARSTIETWLEGQEGFRSIVARARTEKADAAAHEAGVVLAECNPDGEPTKTASARVSLATSRSNYLRWLAACLDRSTYGERPPQVAVAVHVQTLAAFGSLVGNVEGESA